MKFTLRETILLSLAIAFAFIGIYRFFTSVEKYHRLDAYIFFMLAVSALFIFKLQQKAPSKEDTRKNLSKLKKKKK